MPGKVKVRVVAGRSLPVMDRSSDTTDAFAEVKIGDTTFKTDVYRKSLNPAWNSDWFRFELDDMELQDEPLQVRIMDYDTYSANDAIGKVYIDLNPLLLPQQGKRPSTANAGEVTVSKSSKGGTVLSGWLPVYDTMHGIRGEVNLIVKVELFSDLNKFRQSSCGVHFFCCPGVPEGYKAQFLPGFVEELVVNDDPEYKWIDKIRTPRASNEARQLLFTKLSGEVRRKIGLKALELGGNAVIGYRQFFDLEGESGIVVRGIGTAVTLSRCNQGGELSPGSGVPSSSSPRASRENSAGKEYSSSVDNPWSVLRRATSRDMSLPLLDRETSVSECATTPPRALLELTQRRPLRLEFDSPTSGASVGSSGSDKLVARKMARPGGNEGMPEFPFVTLTKFPPGFLVHLGGMVSSKSVKLLEELEDREDRDAREAWWMEIRQEVRSHAKALGCNMVVGYQERTVICEDVLILSVSGTAAVCNLGFMMELDCNALKRSLSKEVGGDCTVCHIPYTEGTVPFPIKVVRCGCCGKGKVGDILITTVEPPTDIEIVGQGGLVQARVFKTKKDLKGENDAREVSDALPFLEYEIHRQLVNKLRVKGMNAIFGLSFSLSLADRMLVGLATGTAVFLAALPHPSLPRVLDGVMSTKEPAHLSRLQERLKEKVEENREFFGLPKDRELPVKNDDIELEEEIGEMELSAGNKDTCVLEVDDIEDADIVDSLLDPQPEQGFQVLSINTPVGVDPNRAITRCQAFSQVWRGKLGLTSSRDFSTASQHLVAAVCFKLRRMQPCLLSSLSWNVDIEDECEVQLALSGVALGFVEQGKKDRREGEEGCTRDGDLIFNLDEIQSETSDKIKLKLGRSPPYFISSAPHIGVNITPTPHVPGARIEHHLGNLNIFYIRETTNSVRESGGLSTFLQKFLCEVLGILRAQVSALGGNAVTSYFMSTCILSHSPHKNQAQCLVNVGGDVVSATYVYKT